MEQEETQMNEFSRGPKIGFNVGKNTDFIRQLHTSTSTS